MAEHFELSALEPSFGGSAWVAIELRRGVLVRCGAIWRGPVVANVSLNAAFWLFKVYVCFVMKSRVTK